MALLAATACGSPGLSTGPTGSGDTLRMEVSGGFVPLEYVQGDLPDWSLLADGRLIVPGPQIEIYPSPALPPLNQRQLTAEAVRTIIERARAAGLQGPDRRYDTMTVSDAPTTTFTITADGVTHTTEVYALGFDVPNASAEERAARAKLQKFSEDLTNLQAWIPAAELGDEETFEPDAMRVFVNEYRNPDEGLTQNVKDWPIAQPLARFGTETDNGYRCGVVEGGDFDSVYAAAREANALTPWRSNGERYGLVFRPLLPGESGC